MKIKKRNKRLVNFNPQKLIKRLTDYPTDVNLRKYIDRAVIDVQTFFYNGITTKEIDERLAQCVSQLSIFEPEMSYLGGYLVITSIEKDLRLSEYNYLDNPVLLDYFKEKYNLHSRPDKPQPRMSYFAAYTMKKEFLLRNEHKELVETPLDFYWRIALATSTSYSQAKEFFNQLTERGFATSNPISVNSGTNKGKLISCTTLSVEDSREGIKKAMNSAADHSANNSGLGIYIGDVRSKMTERSVGGKAAGIRRLVKMLTPMSQFYRQNEKRRGAFAMYCDIWHRDIRDFIPMKRQDLHHSVTDQDGFYGICIPDLFYKRFAEKGEWSLFCPHQVYKEYGWRISDFVSEEFEERYLQIESEAKVNIDKVDASELMMQLVDAMAGSGVPYIFNRDNANREHQQSHLGVLKSYQLCVSGDTLITTPYGQKEIKELENEEINAWNGEVFSKTKFFKTGESKKLIKVLFSNGESLKCTPDHNFFVKNRGDKSSSRIEAQNLVKNDKLESFEYPFIVGVNSFENAYTQGFYSGDGYIYKGAVYKPMIKLYDEKKKLVNLFSTRKKTEAGGLKETDTDYITYNNDGTIVLGLDDSIILDKSFVPDNSYCCKTRLEWLAGLIDSDGTLLSTNSKGAQSIQISSNNRDFLHKVKTTLNFLGVEPKLTACNNPNESLLPDGKGGSRMYKVKPSYRIIINSKDTFLLKELGLKLYRGVFTATKPIRSISHKVKVLKVEVLEGLHDVYCGTEPKINRLMFNGIQASNCIEFAGIHNSEIEAQCDLGSIPLPYHIKNGKFNFKSLSKSVKSLTRLLNNVIDINVWNTERAKKAGLGHRNIGIGILGLADTFAQLDMVYGDEASRELNKEIQKTIYLSALEESNLIAKETGKGFKETLVFTNPQKWIPQELKNSIKEYGVMNHLLTCNMPTSTTSKLLDVTQSFEVFDFPISYRETVLGEFKQVNNYLVQDLKDLGFWNDEVAMELVKHNNVGALAFLPQHIKDKYIDKYKHSNKVFLEMSADRQLFLDQGQSMNLYYDKPERSKISTALYYGWKLGLPSGSYYTTILKQKDVNNLVSDNSKEKPTNSKFDCFGCD
jgi:ribonucleoside-diphosphate reductase alpha chain